MPKPKRMKAYETFDLWAADQSPKHRRLISTLRKLVAKTSPRLSEAVKWGNGCWIGKEWPVLFLHAEEDHLQFGFFGGSELTDPGKLLIGSGKHVRHVKVRKTADIDAAALKRWIRQAAKNERDG
jgi:hypothetical protein